MFDDPLCCRQLAEKYEMEIPRSQVFYRQMCDDSLIRHLGSF